MGIDLPSYRIKIGLFNLSTRNFCISNIHSNAVDTITMALFLVTFLAVLTTTHISLSQPSDHKIQHTGFEHSSPRSTNDYASYIDLYQTQASRVFIHTWFKEPIQLSHDETVPLLNQASVPTYVNSITSIETPVFLRFIGNKAAHVYNGNVSKTVRKSKYPCTICKKV